ncbi:MAG: TraX family protein [Acetatifactor sp.]|jgi:hypothetical protein|nr:TraX family protein [Acetatifactor sp.]
MPCTRNQFKLAAILLMLIDHIGLFLLNNNILFRTVGRLAFPMFVYLLADGYHRTKDLKRYLFRTMSLFLISYFPYSLAMSGGLFFMPQNIYASLFAYLVMYWLLDRPSLPAPGKILVGTIFAFFAVFLQLQYSWYGVAIAIAFFYMQNLGVMNTAFIVTTLGVFYGYGFGFPIQGIGGLSAFLVPPQGDFAPSEKPGKGLQWMTYLFYPVHLLFFALLRI